MGGNRIDHLSRTKSAFIEFFFKPAILSAGIFGAAWINYASHPKSEECLEIDRTCRETALEIWGSEVMAWKLGLFSWIIAGFCESDTAYNVFFRRYVKNLAKKEGFK